ncbi:MAG: XRE family transcriptional regulator [Clostridiales bacterium]|nr:XRE family transcriptional regulator [Clostridiales bacterium]
MFGKRLRAARIARNYTQPALAAYVDVALRSYQCYEQGTRYPSYDLLVKFADILNVPTDWLLERDEYLHSLGVHVDVSL